MTSFPTWWWSKTDALIRCIDYRSKYILITHFLQKFNHKDRLYYIFISFLLQIHTLPSIKSPPNWYKSRNEGINRTFPTEDLYGMEEWLYLCSRKRIQSKNKYTKKGCFQEVYFLRYKRLKDNILKGTCKKRKGDWAIDMICIVIKVFFIKVSF